MEQIDMIPVCDMEKQLMDGTHPCYQEDAGV